MMEVFLFGGRKNNRRLLQWNSLNSNRGQNRTYGFESSVHFNFFLFFSRLLLKSKTVILENSFVH